MANKGAGSNRDYFRSFSYPFKLPKVEPESFYKDTIFPETDEPANCNEATPVPINAEDIENQVPWKGKVGVKLCRTSKPEMKAPWMRLVNKGSDVETVADSKKFCSDGQNLITTVCWSPIAFDLPKYPLQRNEIPIGEMMKEVDKMQKHFQLHGNNIPDKDNIIMVFEILYMLEIDGYITSSSSSSTQIEEVCKIIRSIESKGIETKSVNLYSALKYVRELAKSETEQIYHGLIDVDCFILEMHKRILGSGNQGGEFSTNVRIGIVDHRTGEEHKYPKFESVDDARCTVHQVIDQYNALLDKIKLSYNEDSKSAIENLFKLSAFLLFKITYYHPFGDGNGRLARLLSSYALFLIAPFPTPMYGLFSPSTREEYVDALIEARKNSGIPSTLTALIIESSYYTWKAFNEGVRMANMEEEQTWKELLLSCVNIAKKQDPSELQIENA